MSAPDTTSPPLGARSWAFDLLIAAASASLNASIVLSLTERSALEPKALVVSLALAHSFALAARRWAPWTSFGINLGTGFAVLALGYPMVILGLAPLIALYSIAAQSPRKRSAFALIASIGVLIASVPLTDQAEDLGTLMGNAIGLGGAWLIGTFVYARQFYVRQLEERTLQLESAREELAQQAVTQERLRIARELHDLVAHSLSIITLRSGVAAHVMDEQPDEVRRSLQTIEDVSRDALEEMRRMLTMLRNGDAERIPLPGLRDLGRLKTNVEESGLEIELLLPSDGAPLPPALDLTAYRIVQESLTNVLKHASATRARVVVHKDDGSLTIEVVDDGRAVTQTAQRGHGMVGMAERAQLFGGSLEAGALPEGGYRVRAVLPLSERFTT